MICITIIIHTYSPGMMLMKMLTYVSGYVRHQWRGVPEPAVRAEQRWSGQRDQHEPDQRRGLAAEEERRHAVAHPERPERPVTQTHNQWLLFTASNVWLLLWQERIILA